jgi:ABC-type nitrate/sulfonate/bicarbonate transport system permease component
VTTAPVRLARAAGAAAPASRSRLPAVIAVRVGAAAVVIALWQAFAGGPHSVLPADAVSRPSSVAVALGHLAASGQLFSGLGATALSVLYSMVLGALVGIALAVVTSTRPGRWLLDPLVTILYGIPKVGMISLYIIVLGIATTTHVALVTSAVLFIYYYAMRQALDEVDADRMVALRLMGAGRLRVLRSLVVMSALPQLLSATRIALPLAFATEIFAELQVPTSSGLGVSLQLFSENLDASGAVAVMLFVVLVAYLLDVAVGGFLRRYQRSVGMGVDR